MDKDLGEVYSLNQAFSFALYSIADLQINYNGWTVEDLSSYFTNYGIEDQDSINEIYYTMIDDPGVYLSYYIGYMEIKELLDQAKEQLGSGFDIVEFHRFLLEIGPCQFDIIDERMDMWMERVLSK